MFFEDEKDNIRGAADISIQEDGTVTWEDVLSNEDNDMIVANAQKTKASQSTAPSRADINLGDELELVETDDEVDEQELMQILGNEGSVQTNSGYDTPDLDSKIEGAFSSDMNDNNEDEIVLTPRKAETKASSSSVMPLLVAILFAAIVGGGVYYATQYFTDNQNLNQDAIAPMQQTPQQEMNNINQEMLEQRQQEAANIPVVNEEQANEVKPEEKEIKEEVAQEEEQPKEETPEEKIQRLEKRQRINVIPTGRSNPFLPISKYMTTTIPDTNVDFDRAGIPKPPETYGTKETEASKLMSIAVSGIMYDDTKPSAIITLDNNDYFVQKGDKLDDYKILEIARTYVTLAHNNNVYKANIGEEFKVSNKFYGSAQFIPQTQGGGRQYYSIETQNRSVGVKQSLRYVSEDDITINTK